MAPRPSLSPPSLAIVEPTDGGSDASSRGPMKARPSLAIVEPADEALRRIDEALSEELPLLEILTTLEDDESRPIDEDEVTPRPTRRPPPR